MRYTLTEMKAKRHNDTGLLGVLAMVLEELDAVERSFIHDLTCLTAAKRDRRMWTRTKARRRKRIRKKTRTRRTRSRTGRKLTLKLYDEVCFDCFCSLMIYNRTKRGVIYSYSENS